MSLGTREIKLFWRDIPGFCRDIPEVPEKFEKKCLFSIFVPYGGVRFVPLAHAFGILSWHSLHGSCGPGILASATSRAAMRTALAEETSWGHHLSLVTLERTSRLTTTLCLADWRMHRQALLDLVARIGADNTLGRALSKAVKVCVCLFSGKSKVLVFFRV